MNINQCLHISKPFIQGREKDTDSKISESSDYGNSRAPASCKNSQHIGVGTIMVMMDATFGSMVNSFMCNCSTLLCLILVCDRIAIYKLVPLMGN